MQRLVLAAAVLLATVAPTCAQEPKKFEVFGGFSYYHDPGLRTTDKPVVSQLPIETRHAGWDASFSWNAFHHVAFVGEVSAHYGGRGTYSNELSGAETEGYLISSRTSVETRSYVFAGGPRVFAHWGRVTPFGHVLVGGAVRRETRQYEVTSLLYVGNEGGGTVTEPPIGFRPYDREQTEKGLAIVAGGGLDIELTRDISLRLVQVDAVTADLIDTHRTGLRVSTGIVFRFD